MTTTLTIHRKSGDITVGVNQGSVRRFNLMSEDFIKLKFSLDENIPLVIGDYVDITKYLHSCDNENFQGEIDPSTGELKDETTKLFILDRNYYPVYNKSTGGWDYDVQINAYYHLWKNWIFKYTPDRGAYETSFSLTDTIDTHVKLLIRNLSSVGLQFKGTDYNYIIQAEVLSKGMKVVTYSNTTIYDAMNLIASTFECEWWLDGGSTIYFGYRASEDNINLSLNKEIADASISDSDSTHATRLYAFGGTTNVPKNYRDKLEFKANKVTWEVDNGVTYAHINDTTRPVKPTMFPNIYRAEKNTYQFGSSTESNAGGKEVVCYYDTSIPSNSYDCKIVDYRVYFKPILFGCYGNDVASFKLKTFFEIDKRIVVSTKEEKFDLKVLVGSELDYVKHPYYRIQNGKVKRVGSGTIYSIPIKKGEAYLAHNNGGYSNFSVAFSESDVAEGVSVEILRQFRNPIHGTAYSSYCYYVAQEDGYLYCDYEYATDYLVIKSIGSYSRNLFQGDYSFVEYLEINATSIQVGVEAESIKGVDYPDETILFGIDVANFSLTTQPTAYAARTKATIDGVTYDAIVNPHFLPSTYSEIRVPDVISKNDTYTLPEIIYSEVPSSYFTPEEGSTQLGVVQKNIMMPNYLPEEVELGDRYQYNSQKNYIQLKDTSDMDVVETINVYDWIYPQVIFDITDVTPFTIKVDGDEGSANITSYKIKVKIKSFTSERVVGENLYAIFQPTYDNDGSQTSRVAGLRFELDWDDDDIEEEYVTFKLVPNEDYSAWIPNKVAYPQDGDKIVLEGIDVTFLATNAVSISEVEVLKQAIKDMDKLSKEDKVVDITLNSIYAFDSGRLSLGQKLSLGGILSSQDEAYDSRVIGYEEKLDIPYDSPKYIIGDGNYYSTIGNIESKLEEVNKGSIVLAGGVGGGGGSSVHIIKSGDNTKPNDSNVFSAKRVDENFLHTDIDDEVQGNIAFHQNVTIGGNSSVNGDSSVEGNSFVEGEQTIGRSQIIGRDQEVRGAQLIGGTQEVKGRQTLHQGFITETFTDAGGQIIGAHLTKNGLLTVSGLKAMSFEIFELIYNKIRAKGGKDVFSNAASIEYCEYEMADGSIITPIEYDAWKGSNTYEQWKDGVEGRVWAEHEWDWIGGIKSVLLTIKKDDVNTAVPFRNSDILYGYVNQIGESGEYAKGGQCVMHVVSSNDEIGADGSMTIRAELYPILAPNDSAYDENGELKSGIVLSNIPPTNGMSIAQRGNEYPDGDGGKNKLRLSSFFIDTETSNMYMLSNVTKPMIDSSNYAVVSGQLPTDLWVKVNKEFSQVKETDPVSYAKYLVAENFLQFDHLGQPLKRENNRGAWSKDIAENEDKNKRYKVAADYYDTVTHNGGLWKCIVSDTTEEPSKGSDWLLLVASGKDGQDGLSINDNLLTNTNFDVYDSNGNLKDWEAINHATIVNGAYNGFNSLKTEDRYYSAFDKYFGVTIREGETYTLSCVARTTVFSDRNLADYGSGYVLKIPAESITILKEQGLTTSKVNIDTASSRIDVYFGNRTEWEKKVLTFKYTPPEGHPKEYSDAYFYQYSWNGYAEYTQFKLEVGSDATAYIKHIDDLQGKDAPLSRPNMLANADFSELTSTGLANGWMARYTVVLSDFNGTNVAKLGSSFTLYRTDYTISANKTYTLSFYYKSEDSSSYPKIVLNANTSSGRIIATTSEGASIDEYGSSNIVLSKSSVGEYTFASITFSFSAYETVSGPIRFGCSGTYVYYAMVKLEEGHNATGFTKNFADYSGIEGPAGEAGPMIYPHGEWNSEVTYKREGNTVPYVYFDANELDDTDGKYYVLNVDSSTGVSPADGTTHWRQMTQFEAIYTKFLMANFAQFGSDKGAVFYDRYLISQRGTKTSIDGYYTEVSVGATNYGEVKNEIFNNPEYYSGDDLFTGKFTPNLSINFLTGEIAANNLIDRFFTYDGGTIYMENQFNIIVEPRANRWGSKDGAYGGRFGYSGPYVVLPQDVSHMKNGARITIISTYSEDNLKALNDLGNVDDSGLKGYGYEYSAFSLISTAKPTQVAANKGEKSGNDWIICRGYRSQFMMLPAGYSVSLRLSIIKGVRYWYVEDSYAWTSIHPVEFFVADTTQSSYGPLDMKNFRRVEYRCYDRANNWSDLSWTQEVENQGYKYYKPVVFTYGPIYSEYGDYLGQELPRIVFSTNEKGFKEGFRYRLLDTRGTNGDIFNE